MKKSVNKLGSIAQLVLLLLAFSTGHLSAQVDVDANSNIGLKTTPLADPANNYYPEVSLVGRLDMRYPTNTSLNIVIGEKSGGALTSGSGNLIFGRNVGSAMTTSNSNVLLGSQTGGQLVNGQYNLFIGTFTGNSINGEYNVAIGFGAGSLAGNPNPVCTGNDNLLIGNETGQTIQGAARNNVLIGSRAGWNIQNYRSNVMIGPQAGENATTGFPWTNTENVFIGPRAGQNAQNPSNIFVGSDSGQNSTGGGNIFIGAKAGQQATSASSIFIGSQAGRYATEDNRLIIENSAAPNPLIYGEFNTNLVRVNGKLNVNDVLNLTPRNAEPSPPAMGDVYLDDGTNTGAGVGPKLRYYNGTAWVNL